MLVSKSYNPMLIKLNSIPACVRRIDGRTDRYARGIAKSGTAERDKIALLHHVSHSHRISCQP